MGNVFLISERFISSDHAAQYLIFVDRSKCCRTEWEFSFLFYLQRHDPSICRQRGSSLALCCFRVQTDDCDIKLISRKKSEPSLRGSLRKIQIYRLVKKKKKAFFHHLKILQSHWCWSLLSFSFSNNTILNTSSTKCNLLNVSSRGYTTHICKILQSHSQLVKNWPLGLWEVSATIPKQEF